MMLVKPSIVPKAPTFALSFLKPLMCPCKILNFLNYLIVFPYPPQKSCHLDSLLLKLFIAVSIPFTM